MKSFITSRPVSLVYVCRVVVRAEEVDQSKIAITNHAVVSGVESLCVYGC